MMYTGTLLFLAASQVLHIWLRNAHCNSLNCMAEINLIFDELFLNPHSEKLSLLRKTCYFHGGYFNLLKKNIQNDCLCLKVSSPHDLPTQILSCRNEYARFAALLRTDNGKMYGLISWQNTDTF